MTLLSSKWEKVTSEPTIDPAFKTHANYIKYLSDITQNIEFTVNCSITQTITPDKELYKKVQLANITLQNLKGEMSTINNLHEYAVVCSSWVSVKSYYILFNLQIIINYLFYCDKKVLTKSTHKGVNDHFKKKLEEGIFEFSESKFNDVYVSKDILTWKIQSGTNLRNADEDRNLQIVKKLYEYTKDEFKRQNNISSLRGSRKNDFEEKTHICLAEFFYWYRIKANYRDLEYLNVDVDTEDFFIYFTDYYNTIINVSNALICEINRVSNSRFSKGLFTLSE